MKRKSTDKTNPMEKAKSFHPENIEQQPLRVFTEKAYLDYSMYVILDRALPHIGDGLKPVQRRIIYAMSELGLTTLAKHKKSARTVGDVLGKFHPHGESACYEAMVLMAQSFSYHYPLIDGQGNWGSQDDPKSFAAMRYTESRLTPYAQILLAELADGTVDWLPNFDATLQEPRLLPARLPNILLNGATGIAVGMATDIPPHNLTEVINACVHLLDNPKANLTDICQYIKGPDFPSLAEITTPYAEIYAAYQEGYGSIQARAVYTKEKEQIIITALPYQVSGTKIMTQIAEQIREKKLSLIEDLKDESDHENPTRLIIVPRSNRVDADALMAHLFATTDLERSYRINLNMIGLDGRPGVKSLVTILQEWLDYRQETVRKRLTFRLNKIETRLQLLKGFLTVYRHLNEIIQIIREQDNPKQYLISHFQLSDIQADAILEMRLRQLAKLEENKLLTEQENLLEEGDRIKKTLDSKTKLKNLVRSELQEDAKRHGNKRMSPLIQRDPAQILQKTEIIASEPMTIILSARGWVRAAKGHDFDVNSLNFKTGDSLKASVPGRSNQFVVFIDSTGRSYSTPIHTLPSARSSGEPLTSRFNPPAEAHFQAVITGDPEQSILVSSDAGYGFITQLATLYSKNRNGKNLLTLPKYAHVLSPRLIDDLKASAIAIATNRGYLLIITAQEIPVQLKGKGNKIIQIPGHKDKSQKEYVVDIAVLPPNAKKLILISGKKRSALPLSSLAQYRGKRGQRGRRLAGFQKLDHLSIELGN